MHGDSTSPTILQTSAISARLGTGGAIISLSRGLVLAMAQDQNDAPTLTYASLAHALDLPSWDQLIAQMPDEEHYQKLVWLLKDNGSAVRHIVSVATFDQVQNDGAEYLVQGVNFSQVAQLSRQLELQAYQDPLTGAFNRRYLNEVAPTMIAESEKALVVVVDLQDFKGVNDTYGHEFGDKLLCHVANVITEVAPLGSLVVRLGGDEFAVLVEGVETTEWCVGLCEEIATAIATPLPCPDGAIAQRANIGMSISPAGGNSIEALLAGADQKMYHAKRAGVSNIDVAATPPKTVSPTKTVASEILRGLDHQQFLPHYQPVFDVCAGKIVGAEALSRWHDSTGKLRKPIEFVPIASSHGMIARIDRTIFQNVCSDLARWKRLGHGDLEIAVNLAATTFGEPEIVDFLIDTVEANGLSPNNICLELTESVTLHENDPGWERISALHELGFSLALDDFGTGYSSLALVRILPVTRLKIDCSFIQDILGSEKDRKIVASIFELSKALGTETVVEGVESWNQAKALNDLGARLCQGFLFSKPIPADQFETAFLVHGAAGMSGEDGAGSQSEMANFASATQKADMLRSPNLSHQSAVRPH